MLTVKNINKNYGNTNALKNVNIQFKKGKVTSIYGPNGAGKSTLVKIICGIEKEYEGEIFLNDKITKANSYTQAIQQGISYVPQDFGLINNMTVRENLGIIQNTNNPVFFYKKNEIEKFITNNESDLPLPKLDTLVSKLSASEQQLLAIHKSLIFNSEIIIFDEPTTNLNQFDFKLFKEIILKLKKEGKIIIFISHRLKEVFSISDELITLKDGMILKSSVVSQISEEEIIDLFKESTLLQKGKKERAKVNSLCEINLNKSSDLYKNINIKIDKGDIISIDLGNMTLNHNIGYYIFNILSSEKKVKVGIVPAQREDEGLFKNLNIRDNLILNHFQRKIYKSSKDLNLALNELAQKLKLKYENWNQNIDELSGGNKQKIIFGRWLLADFDLLILIEPTSGIDLETKNIIHKMIIDLQNKGKSFILISSDETEHEILQNKKVQLGHKN